MFKWIKQLREKDTICGCEMEKMLNDNQPQINLIFRLWKSLPLKIKVVIFHSMEDEIKKNG